MSSATATEYLLFVMISLFLELQAVAEMRGNTDQNESQGS